MARRGMRIHDRLNVSRHAALHGIRRHLHVPRNVEGISCLRVGHRVRRSSVGRRVHPHREHRWAGHHRRRMPLLHASASVKRTVVPPSRRALLGRPISEAYSTPLAPLYPELSTFGAVRWVEWGISLRRCGDRRWLISEFRHLLRRVCIPSYHGLRHGRRWTVNS